jgi:hypothetical protein
MGTEIGSSTSVSSGYYSETCHDSSVPPELPGSELRDEIESESEACRRQRAEFLLADTACVGSALWTVGSLPSVLGAVGGGLVTVATCAYAGLKADDRDAACGTTSNPANSDPMAMERPIDQR